MADETMADEAMADEAMSEATADAPASPLLEAMREAGGVTGDYHGRTLVRRFGDPSAEYEAATTAAAVFDRSHRTRLIVKGRAPAQMLTGVLTGTMPGEPEPVRDDVLGGRATYHAVLTPKGKMIADLWSYRLGDETEAGFLLDVPVAARSGLLEHFGKFLPPRLAAVEDVSGDTAMIMVSGPDAAALLSRTALGLRVGAEELSALDEGEWRSTGASAREGLLVSRTADVWPDAYNVVGPAAAVVALWKALVASGAAPAGLGVWQTLRVEAGRPAYGTDMTDTTIPVEAGIHDRAIDYKKGCYTGQEVIVRIRDRGKVNRTLRRIHLGDVPAPEKGAELFRRGEDGGPEGRSVGWVTSVVQSPKFGGTLALGYVRSEVDEKDVMVG